MSAVDKLEARLRALRSTGRKGIAPYLTAGDGGTASTLAVLRELADLDVPCAVLGVPYGDPIADGPMVQAANDRALAAGTTFEEVLEILSRLRRGGPGELGRDLPVVVMSYASPLVRRGWTNAVTALARAGADGLIVADLPLEEAGAMHAAARTAGIAPVFAVTPTTSEQRTTSAIQLSRGFVYALGRLAVSGTRNELDEQAQSFLARVRRVAGGLPIAVGSGITSAEDVGAALRHADLAVVGSAFVEHVHQSVSAAVAPRKLDAARLATREFLQVLTVGIPS